MIRQVRVVYSAGVQQARSTAQIFHHNSEGDEHLFLWVVHEEDGLESTPYFSKREDWLSDPAHELVALAKALCEPYWEDVGCGIEVRATCPDLQKRLRLAPVEASHLRIMGLDVEDETELARWDLERFFLDPLLAWDEVMSILIAR